MEDVSTRGTNRLTSNTLALVLAVGRGALLYELTEWRAKAALHFGGKYRVIDFALSNCINSGVRRVGVVTQYKAHSLLQHLMRGWSHFRGELGEFVEILPASQQKADLWYSGTADAIYQNLHFIRARDPAYVLIIPGDHLCRMDFGLMLSEHQRAGADVTMACIRVPSGEASGMEQVVTRDGDGWVTRLESGCAPSHEASSLPAHSLVSVGCYVFNTKVLIDCLLRDASAADSSHGFCEDVIPGLLGKRKICAYITTYPNTQDDPYWCHLPDLDSYLAANIGLVSKHPFLSLYDQDWPLWTYQEQLPPAKFVWNQEDRRGLALDSIIAGGTILSGCRVSGSVVSSNVRVNSYASVDTCVLLPDVEVGRHAKLRNAIVGRGCVIPAGFEIGYDAAHDRGHGFRVTAAGTTLVTRTML